MLRWHLIIVYVRCQKLGWPTHWWFGLTNPLVVQRFKKLGDRSSRSPWVFAYASTTAERTRTFSAMSRVKGNNDSKRLNNEMPMQCLKHLVGVTDLVIVAKTVIGANNTHEKYFGSFYFLFWGEMLASLVSCKTIAIKRWVHCARHIQFLKFCRFHWTSKYSKWIIIIHSPDTLNEVVFSSVANANKLSILWTTIGASGPIPDLNIRHVVAPWWAADPLRRTWRAYTTNSAVQKQLMAPTESVELAGRSPDARHSFIIKLWVSFAAICRWPAVAPIF